MSTGETRTRHSGWRRPGVVTGVLVGLVATIGLAPSFGRGSEAPARVAGFRLPLAAPRTLSAGDGWVIELGEPRPSSDGVVTPSSTATVTVSGPWGSRSITTTVADGRIEVPDGYTDRSGVVTATVRVGDWSGTVSTVVTPGPAVDGTTPLAGPRSMVADGAHWTMVTSLPRDRFGNVVTDGTPVDVVVRRPDGSVEVVTTEVRSQLAAVRVFSTTLAGRSTFRVDVDTATGPEVDVLEAPGPPVPFGLSEPGLPVRSDGRQLFVVSTDRLVDTNGNELLDGTVAVASVESPTGRATARSVTIDGVAEFVLEAPTEPGPVDVEVVVDGVRSSVLRVEVAPDVTDLRVDVVLHDGVLHITVGPVLTGLGGFVPDGTEAIVRYDDRSARVVLVDGRGSLEIPWPPAGNGADPSAPPSLVVVEVLGVSRTVRPR